MGHLTVRLSVVKSVLLVVLVLTMSNGTAQIIGRLQPVNLVLRGFVESCTDKPRACWHGVVPGVTTTEDSIRLLNDANFTSASDQVLHWQNIVFSTTLMDVTIYQQRSIVAFIDITFRENVHVQLGDVMTVIGSPTQMDLNIPRRGQSSVVVDKLWFGDEILVDVENFPSGMSIASYKRTSRITLFDSTAHVSDRWHGFVPGWRFCRLEPASWVC